MWTGQALSLFGSQLVSFALIWWLTKTTGSATVLATASIVGLVPQVLLMPFAGALVDRWNRKTIMMISDTAVAVFTLGLALVFLSGATRLWHLYVLMFLRSAAGGFHWPAMEASTSLLVPKEHLSRIQGLNQALRGGMNIVSAPLGALLLSWLPMQAILAIDVLTATVAVGALSLVHVPRPPRTQIAEGKHLGSTVFHDFAAGLRFLWGWKGLVLVGAMATVINLLLTPAFSLLPILVTGHFGLGALELATLQAAMGIGVVVGGVALGAWGGFKRRVHTSLAGLLAMAAGCVGLGLLPPTFFAAAVGLVFLLGAANTMVNGPLFAVLQAVVPADMQGRVFTLIASVSAAMSPLGLLIAGPLADRFGLQLWFLVGGVVTAIMGAAGFFLRPIRKLEEGRAGGGAAGVAAA